jgi:hypothetical protein
MVAGGAEMVPGSLPEDQLEWPDQINKRLSIIGKAVGDLYETQLDLSPGRNNAKPIIKPSDASVSTLGQSTPVWSASWLYPPHLVYLDP